MRRLFTSIAAVVLVTACTAGGDGTTPPTGTPGITLAASASSGTVALGASSTTTLTLTRVDGYSGAVALTAQGAPTGVTVSFAPPLLTGTTLASTATISVASNATAGPASLTFRASGTGVTDKTVVYALTIPTPGITVSAGTATVTAAQGTTVTAPITITRTNGATAAVTLTAEGLPSNVTASFSPNPIASGSTTSTLTLVVGSGANVALSTITVRAAATGLTDQTATFPLSITSAAVPAYTLSPTPAAVSIVAGQSGQSILTIAKSGGFAGSVALALEGAPTGLTGTFAPNPAPGTTATLTINTTLATVPGTYSLTVRGTTAGLTDRTTTVSVTVTAVAGITVTLAPPALSIAQGANAQTAITLVRLGGLTGDLQMTASGIPAGLTVGFAPTTVTGSASTLTVTVGAGVPAGVYPIVVTATGAGAVVGSATLTVTVTTPSGFTLSATGVSIAQGALGTSTLTVTRIGGFANNVDLIASNVPANVTVSFAPASVAGTTSTITFTVGAAAVAGSYTVMINGTGTGAANQATTVALTITSGGGGTVGFRFCDATQVPLWLAYRNGTSGAWSRVTPSGNNTFSFSLTGNIGAVAFVQNEVGGGTQGTVYLGTAAELTSIGTNECVTNTGVVTKTVNGTISGLSAMQTGYAFMGGGSGAVTGPATAFQVSDVENRMTDLLALRTTTVAVPFSITADRGALRRNVNYAAGSTAPALSFTGAESFALATATVTLLNAGAETTNLFTAFSTSNGDVGSLFIPGVTAGGALGVPSTHTAPGDFHQFLATAAPADFLSFRLVFQYNRDLANRTLTFGAPLNLPTLTTVATSPYARLKVVGTWQAEYGGIAATDMTQSSGASFRAWSIQGSRGYFGASSQFELELPDFTGTAGFLNSWGLTVGSATEVTTFATGAIAGTLGVIAEGSAYRAASRVQTITP